MPARRHVLLCLLLLCVAAVLPPSARAVDEAAGKQQQLEVLRARLAKVQSNREQELKRRDAVQVQLRQSERGIATLTRQLADLDAQLAAGQTRLSSLQRQQAVGQATLAAHKQAMAQQIRAAYMEGRDSQLKLLLDAQDPDAVGRLLAYYDYLNRARAARMTEVQQELAALDSVNAQIQQQLDGLKSLRDSRAAALAELEQQRGARRQMLAKLNSDIKSRDAEIGKLKRDQQALQSLLNELQQAMSDVPPELEQGHRFSSLRGHLLWPVRGKLLKRYGETRAGGHMRWDGDLIAAPAGTPVRAVSYGRVVYADWMPHFGLLVILDHGEGYLSVYAHNQSVTHLVGDWVKAGDTIATLGESGGQDEPALYFEIRHRNDTLDPRKWCRGRLPD